MRILHTSDWHLGRTFGQFSLSDDQQAFTDWFVGQCQEQQADLVIIAGDVYDRAVAPREAIVHFRRVLSELLATGARVAVITGNHDGPERVAAYDELLDGSGAVLRGGYRGAGQVTTLEFSDGPLDLVLLPYLDPQAAPDDFGADDGPDPDPGPRSGSDGPARTDARADADDAYGRLMRRTHESVLRDAITAARGRLQAGRSVAVAHAFVAGCEVSDSERDLLVGGAATVPAALFQGFSYTALGHLHRPQAVGAPHVRYSGSPLPYSFSETGAKSIVVVDLDASGAAEVHTVSVPVGRSVRTVTGPIEELLAATPEPQDRHCFVRAVLTDPGVVLDAKARLARRWPWVAEIELRPAGAAGTDRAAGLGERGAGSPQDVVIEFWQAANGRPPTEPERDLLFGLLGTATARGVS